MSTKIYDEKKCYFDDCDKDVVCIMYNYTDYYTVYLCMDHFFTSEQIETEATFELIFQPVSVKNPKKIHKQTIIESSELCEFINKKGKKCDKYKLYGINGFEPKFCNAHKQEGMVKNPDRKKCIVEKCSNTANYGINKQEINFCYKHRTKEMKRHNKIIKCMVEECVEEARYCYQDQQPILCQKHIKENMINYYTQKCAVEGCNTVASLMSEHIKNKYCKKHAIF